MVTMEGLDAVTGILVSTAIVTMLVFFGIYKCIETCQRRRHMYERVAHELDAEERDFKRALEGRDEPDDFFSDDETAQLEMIEKYRDNLLNDDDDDDDEESARLNVKGD